MKPKLHVVHGPDRAVLIADLGPLDPGPSGWSIARCDQRFRLVDVEINASFPRPRLERLVRRIPGVGRIVGWIFRARDADDRARATALAKIEHVAVGGAVCPPDEVDDLPTAAVGTEISVRVTNAGSRPIVARVIVEGVTS